MNKEIMAYQDGAYDSLKQLPDRIRNCGFQTAEEVIRFIERTLAQMDEMSTRKLGSAT